MPQLMPMMWLISGFSYLLVFLFGAIIFSLLEGGKVSNNESMGGFSLFKWCW